VSTAEKLLGFIQQFSHPSTCNQLELNFPCMLMGDRFFNWRAPGPYIISKFAEQLWLKKRTTSRRQIWQDSNKIRRTIWNSGGYGSNQLIDSWHQFKAIPCGLRAYSTPFVKMQDVPTRKTSSRTVQKVIQHLISNTYYSSAKVATSFTIACASSPKVYQTQSKKNFFEDRNF
jgi:hypothetical protein